MSLAEHPIDSFYDFCLIEILIEHIAISIFLKFKTFCGRFDTSNKFQISGFIKQSVACEHHRIRMYVRRAVRDLRLSQPEYVCK